MVPNQPARGCGCACVTEPKSRRAQGLQCTRSVYGLDQSCCPLPPLCYAVCGDVAHAPTPPGVLGRAYAPAHVGGPDLGLSRCDQSDVDPTYRLALVHRLT